MRPKNSLLSNILFFAGIAAGLALALVSLWADYEALRYFFTGARFDSFRGMNCPALATRSETIPISASLANPSDRAAQPFYRVSISGPLGRSFDNQISLPPGGAQQVEWTVSADDIDLRYFIITKIMVFAYGGLPTREASCGIFVLDIGGLTGEQVLIAWLALSLIWIIAGLALWERPAGAAGPELTQPGRMRQALALVVILAILSSLAGWALAGAILSVVAMLLLFIAVFISLQS